METSSPPLTPIRHYMSPLDTSPASSYREQLRRRNSSFSSNHDRSPTTPRSSRHRFSNASQLSHDFPTPGDEGGGGLGNLADELGELDDEEYFEEDTTDAAIDGPQQREVAEKEPRDSGIDVTYNSRRTSPAVRNFSKPFAIAEKPPDEEEAEAEQEDRLSPDMEDAMNNIARMTSYSWTSEDPLITRTMALLQDLGNQSSLESAAQRLTTSTNSLTAHLIAQEKSLKILSASLYSPFVAFSAMLDVEAVDEVAPLIDELLKELPLPDAAPLQGMQKLERETTNVLQTLSHLTDTLQMGKQITNSASRHLRTTQTMVAELRRERERADLARHEISKSHVGERLSARKCASECKDVMAGFEEVCDVLRASLEQDVGGGDGA